METAFSSRWYYRDLPPLLQMTVREALPFFLEWVTPAHLGSSWLWRSLILGIKNGMVDKGSEGPGFPKRMVEEVLGGSLSGGPIRGWTEILYFSQVVSRACMDQWGCLGQFESISESYLKFFLSEGGICVCSHCIKEPTLWLSGE